MRNTYVIKYVSASEEFTTLTLEATEAQAVAYLYNNVERTEASYMPVCPASMQAYMQSVRDYMEENGGCAIWEIVCNNVQLEQYVNDYEWGDTWERATENGGSYKNITINI